MSAANFRFRQVPEGEVHDELTERAIGAAIEVHRRPGPGLNEAIYEAALGHEYGLRQIHFQRPVEIPVIYKGITVGKTRIDLLVEDQLIVELKACDALSSVLREQCITYLRVSGHKICLIINFNVTILKDGIKRIVLTD